MTMGNDGIIGKAQSAVDMYKNAQEKEEIELAKVSNEINRYVDGNRGEQENFIFSKNEKVVGKWIDGRSIYSKTIEGTFETGTPGSNWKEIVLVPNIDIIVNAIGWYNNYDYTCTISEIGIEDSETGKVELQTANGRTLTAITIQYVKTTDKETSN